MQPERGERTSNLSLSTFRLLNDTNVDRVGVAVTPARPAGAHAAPSVIGPAAGAHLASSLNPRAKEASMLFGTEHVERYRATGGEEGHDWQGTKALILTTTGRKSGAERDSPLIYGEHGDDYIVVASKGGAPDHPAWYKNLVEHPHVRVQVGPEVFDASARTATAEERSELWALMTKEWPAYDEYQTKTEREIPLVVLERA